MMSNFVTFQTQLGAILEILAKAAMAEINRCVDDSCAVFRLEISQSQTEIETLKHKLQNLERELLDTRKKKTVSVFRQQSSFKPRGRDDRTVVENVNTPSKPSITENQPRCEGLPVKQERPAEDIFISDERLKPSAEDHVTQTIPLEDGKKSDTEPTPVRDPEELREQHRCGRGDEELSGLEFVVKAEQEGNVAQRLNQTGCELGVGRINTLDSEYVMYESENQLWTSFTQRNSDTEHGDMVCSNAAEQCSQSLPIHSPLRYTSATMEGSGETPSSSEASYAEEFATMGERPPVCSVVLRSEAIHTQQGEFRERLVHTAERENQTLLPQQQQHGPSVRHRRGSESPAQPHSDSPYETGSALSIAAFNTRGMSETDGHADCGKKFFICSFCGKGFTSSSTLTNHLRIHTGEKPYSCAQCGQSFNRKSNLVQHEKVHSGCRPFGCTHCGKRFVRGTHLRQHLRIHMRNRVIAPSVRGVSDF